VFGAYKIGVELLIINAAITYLLLFIFSRKGKSAIGLIENELAPTN